MMMSTIDDYTKRENARCLKHHFSEPESVSLSLSLFLFFLSSKTSSVFFSLRAQTRSRVSCIIHAFFDVSHTGTERLVSTTINQGLGRRGILIFLRIITHFIWKMRSAFFSRSCIFSSRLFLSGARERSHCTPLIITLFLSPPNRNRYCPKTTRDGASVTEWTDPYDPTPEQEAIDRQKAFEAGIPHGEYVYRQRYGDCPILSLLVVSELHTDTEYGGPFWIHVPSKIRVSDLRDHIRDRCGIMPGLMKLAYRGQSFEDESRKLEHYGVRYWNKKFPDWPLVILRG